MTVQLKIRRLKTGETMIAEFTSFADAETWLRERPKFVDVLGSVSTLGEDQDMRLRRAMRPLDEDERELVASQDAAAQAAVQQALQREQERARKAMEERAEALSTADPNRPMHIAWDRETGMALGDPADPREIPAVVREAVLAWVAERDTWVHPRNCYVATANLMVWPGPLPKGEDERVQQGGQFTTLSGDPPQA
ncbi:hypothetical protein G6O69_11335 [Pseudenhygromyxa sp. WMMC2535]|uniref:hypothetical protein n=1 Tax=Pseudenhygromyxa sp. WMMC2535 TaxID=2712867 RepID=UPI001555C5FF|nr:hypothetical protein [Pseudenhygromyxa sp. WMMC2535]NVB38425.1 hypothetical protein [Pseudenhygromyxa sp. WMMC2535]